MLEFRWTTLKWHNRPISNEGVFVIQREQEKEHPGGKTKLHLYCKSNYETGNGGSCPHWPNSISTVTHAALCHQI